MKEKFPGQDGAPGTERTSSVLVRMTNGELVSVDSLLSHEKDIEPVEFPLASLKEEDLITATWEDGDYKPGSFSFRLKRGNRTGLSISDGSAPTKSWEVEIENGIPGISGSMPARFVGSGFGGSMVSPNRLMSGRSLVFGLEGRREWRSPFVNQLKILRNEGEAYKVLSAAQAVERNKEIDMVHQARMGQFKRLMDHFQFQFDFKDGTKSSDGFVRFEGERMVADFHAGMAAGNTLEMFDKEKHRWVSYRYFNWKGEDALQIAYADVDPESFKKESGFGGETYTSLGPDAVRRTGGWLATYTTAPSQELEALVYHVSDADARDVLRIPALGVTQPSPGLEIVTGEAARIHDEYPMSAALDEDPELKKRIVAALSAERTSDGGAIIRIDSEKRVLLSPESVFAELPIQ